MAAPVPKVSPQESTTTVPPYVLQYAPLVYLASDEVYFPSNLASQLTHTTPQVNFKPITGYPTPLTLSNIDSLNSHGGTNVYLTANDDPTTLPPPAWVAGVKPDATGKTEGATSCCVITLDHGNGTLDAFYFYFYAYNEGNRVLGKEYGDHVADWEHNMVRFVDGKPTGVWYSQHSTGEAFAYHAVVKDPKGIRPISYSAKGSHANYAIPGSHDHTLPNFDLEFGFVEDHASKGLLWDPVQNAYFYHSDPTGKIFTAYNGTDPTGWLSFQGQWGDEQYPKSDKRQRETFGKAGLAQYVGGPNGPQFKQIVRKNVWPDSVKDGWLRPFLTV